MFTLRNNAVERHGLSVTRPGVSRRHPQERRPSISHKYLLKQIMKRDPQRKRITENEPGLRRRIQSPRLEVKSDPLPKPRAQGKGKRRPRKLIARKRKPPSPAPIAKTKTRPARLLVNPRDDQHVDAPSLPVVIERRKLMTTLPMLRCLLLIP